MKTQVDRIITRDSKKAIDPSLEVVLRCLQPTIEDGHFDRVRVLVTKPAFRWKRVMEIARRHAVMALLYDRLHTYCPDVLPGTVETELRDRSRRIAVKNRYMTVALLELLDRFQNRGVRAIPYKGPTLARAVYDDVGIRNFTDLDILVAMNDIESASSVLEDQGYEWVERPLQPTDAVLTGGPFVHPLIDELKFYRESDGLLVEIGWQIHKPSVPIDLDYDSLWSRRTRVSLSDGSVNGLSAVDRLLVLAHHGSRHRWASLKWIADFAAALHQDDLPSWDRVFERARDAKIERRLRIAAGLSATLLDVSLPSDVHQEIRTDEPALHLIDDIAEQYFADPLVGPGDKLDLNYRSLTTDTRHDAARAAIAPLLPKLADYRWMPLPQRFFACYYLVRPVRLVTARLLPTIGQFRTDR